MEGYILQWMDKACLIWKTMCIIFCAQSSIFIGYICASILHVQTYILRVPGQNGVSLLYIMLEIYIYNIYYSGREPSNYTSFRSLLELAISYIASTELRISRAAVECMRCQVVCHVPELLHSVNWLWVVFVWRHFACILQILELVTETRILAEMKMENRGKKCFPWGEKIDKYTFFL